MRLHVLFAAMPGFSIWSCWGAHADARVVGQNDRVWKAKRLCPHDSDLPDLNAAGGAGALRSGPHHVSGGCGMRVERRAEQAANAWWPPGYLALWHPNVVGRSSRLPETFV